MMIGVVFILVFFFSDDLRPFFAEPAYHTIKRPFWTKNVPLLFSVKRVRVNLLFLETQYRLSRKKSSWPPRKSKGK